MPNSEERLEEMIQSLRGKGLRITPQRLAILRILATSREHPTAEAIYQQVHAQFPTTSLATIYKTVSLLGELGEIRQLSFGEQRSRYNGATPHPHPHLVCVRCRRVQDLNLDDLQYLEARVARDTDYHILGHRLDFFGICPQCQESTD